MPSTYSTSLRLELIGNGEQAANWGNTTNTNLGTLIEQAIAGVQSIAMLDANYTLVSGNGIADEARNAVLVMTGTLTATRNVIVPTVEKFYAVRNATTNGQSIVVKTSAGTGVTLSNGFTQLMYCDGTNVVLASVPVKASDGSIGGPVIITDNSSSAALRITQTGTGNALLVEDSANPDSSPFVVDASGNVGVGTGSPSAPLTVKARSADALSLRVLEAGGYGIIQFTDDPVTIERGRLGADSAGNVTLGASGTVQITTNSTERMRITSTGNVGIGTSSPVSNLSVSKASNVQMQATTGTIDYRAQCIDASSIAYSGTVSNHAFGFTTNNAERMRIDSSGNVGIGTSSPRSRLDLASGVISGVANIGGQSNSGAYSIWGGESALNGGYIQFFGSTSSNPYVLLLGNSNSGETARIDSSGNVGIGTASPTAKLDVAGVIKSQGATVDAFPSGTVLLFAQTTAPTGWTKITAHNDKALRVVSGAAGSGGSVAFTTAFASQAVSGTVGNTTLTIDQIPAHSHVVYDPGHKHATLKGTGGGQPSFVDTGNGGSSGNNDSFMSLAGTGISINNTGGSNSHNHTFTGTAINLAVQYVDVILASKN